MPRKATDISRQLERASTCEGPALLEALLEAYRARPLTPLVELIELVGKRVAVQHSTKGSLDDQHAIWLEVAGQRRAVDLEWLIANVITGRGEYSIERIAKLIDWPIDPRLPSGLLALADGKRMSTFRSFWKDVFRIISRQAHPRLAPTLDKALGLAPQTAFERMLLERLHGLRTKLDKLVPVSPSTTETAALAVLASRLELARVHAAAKTEDDFLREIWAAPDDDGPREVFADWLLERGDPRGEFISLQLAHHRQRLRVAGRKRPDPGDFLGEAALKSPQAVARERALLAKHRREWLAPLEPYLSIPSSSFYRGFLYAAVVHWRKLAAMPAIMTHPAWATVKRFRIDAEGTDACGPWIDHMVRLGAKWA